MNRASTGSEGNRLNKTMALVRQTSRGAAGAVRMAGRRMRGEYHVDDWGVDEEFRRGFWPVLDFFYKHYFRVSVTGIENVPAQGRALLVGNHGGVFPFDGAMVMCAILSEHPQPRLARTLHVDLISKWPFATHWTSRLGGVQANPDNTRKLLEEDRLTIVFPEGAKGLGKPFSKRYQLQRFGRGGFVKVALQTRSPIIPVSIVGAEEIYPMLYDVKPLASLLGLPWVPVTFTFPWMGPLGALPLPSKWHIDFGAPITWDDKEWRPSEEPLLVSKTSARVRNVIQEKVNQLLAKRTSVFYS